MYVGVKDRPDSQCDMLLSYVLQENVWLPSDRIRAAELITKETLLSRVQTLLSYSPSKVTSYYHGDLPSQSALGLNMECTAALSATASISKPVTEVVATNPVDCVDAPSRARILPVGHQTVALPCFNSDDINSALVVHIQVIAAYNIS
jgi:secreted Zn-dependent insulinase-like peptidase